VRIISPQQFEGVWSATPTPFTKDWRIDLESVERLVEHHLRLGVQGLFLAGTCGEGAWMADGERRKLVRHVVEIARGRLGIAVQVSDNSATRILDNIAQAQEDGADLVVIAPPYFVMNAVPTMLRDLYLEAIRGSSLPVCVYDLGKNRQHSPSPELLAELYREPNVVAVKDSSGDDARMQIALEARRKRPDLRLLNGDEFNCVKYLQAGYDGLMLGGAAFHGALAKKIMQVVADGKIERALELQERMNRIMFAVYGGENISCWLAGAKKLLMELGIFQSWNNYPHYPLTQGCIAAMKKVVKNDADILLP
jgi:4-hydroxy-tetrahydrodipicolinate synthase